MVVVDPEAADLERPRGLPPIGTPGVPHHPTQHISLPQHCSREVETAYFVEVPVRSLQVAPARESAAADGVSLRHAEACAAMHDGSTADLRHRRSAYGYLEREHSS